MALDSPASIDSKSTVKAPRHFLRTALKIIGAHIILILLLMIPLIIHANRQAERDWIEFKTHWEAKGEIFDLEKLIPAEIPDEENFAATSIIAELFDRLSGSRLEKLSWYKLQGVAELSHFDQDARLSIGGHQGNLSNYLEKSESYSTEEEAAKAILKILKPLAPLIKELEQASLISETRFPIDYEKPWELDLSHITTIYEVSKTIDLRARSNLSLKDSTGATRDLLTMIRIAALIGSEPLLISNRVEGKIYQGVTKTIWMGLESGNLDTADLKQLMTTLQNHQLKSRFVKGVRTERAILMRMNQIKMESYLSYYAGFSSHDDPVVIMYRGFKTFGLSKNFWSRNKLNYSNFIQDHFLTIDGKVSRDWVDLDAVLNTRTDLNKFDTPILFPINPYAIFILQNARGFESVAKTTARTSTRIDLCRVAIALELYRREHGNYPDTLTPLAPRYIDSLPPDLITNTPLHYRINADDTFTLYSIGIDMTDDGGLPVKRKFWGDWVWQYTLPDEFIQEIENSK